MEDKQQFDLIVIGGGPAGMMCAGRAAERGARVVLLEKNQVLGKKLSLTGGGRCNLTNATANVRDLVARYGKGGKALFPSFSRFGPADAVAFFNGLGLATKVEGEGRVFPVSDDADDVVRALAGGMEKGKVRVVLNAAVENVVAYDAYVRVNSSAGEFRARAAVVATGGTAYPETGSTGEGFAWLGKLGHKIVADDASLVPIAVEERWVAGLSGVSFSAVRVVCFENGKKVASKTGKLLFTHFGLSGPVILNMSKGIGDALKKGKAVISLDLLPEKSTAEVDKEILSVFAENQNKKLKNVVSRFMPEGTAEAALEVNGLNGEKFVNSVSRDERLKLIKFAKDMRFSVTGLLGLDKAVVSSGGVDPSEVDMRTMRSKIKPNIYILGDALNFNRPSGGFSLQICWTTGYLAGSSVEIVRPLHRRSLARRHHDDNDI
jgi:predicted Rossmann fold flavoprotein